MGQRIGGAPSGKSNKCEGAKLPSRGMVSGRGCPSTQDREIFQFLRSKSSDLVHAVMRFLTLYLIRICTTHTETGSEFVFFLNEKKKSVKVTQKHKHISTYTINAVPFCGMALFINDKIPTKH